VPGLADERAVHGEMPPRLNASSATPTAVTAACTRPSLASQGVGTNGVRHGLLGGPQPVGAHQRQLGERQRGVGGLS